MVLSRESEEGSRVSRQTPFQRGQEKLVRIRIPPQITTNGRYEDTPPIRLQRIKLARVIVRCRGTSFHRPIIPTRGPKNTVEYLSSLSPFLPVTMQGNPDFVVLPFQGSHVAMQRIARLRLRRCGWSDAQELVPLVGGYRTVTLYPTVRALYVTVKATVRSIVIPVIRQCGPQLRETPITCCFIPLIQCTSWIADRHVSTLNLCWVRSFPIWE
ncbi:hypothetical protein SODALDRAFT_118710 [Sodiomyces alkalinus F11]|uniref:Uncharacterized protein n=1 Tax=Sodiomyces alkalinus (strain CBS 110278 / VKM F-3762 / F11) TaxID=1314773 RepID=A0A3N2Q3W2_SODAK|nr:hypothetical protein SODALDRAFT_118710 [Sodiomyces alkalinus F11]ROT41406.1 hypothetical protein SODALDRAFT_118710 [Sodiomyces alkalinus F11]